MQPQEIERLSTIAEDSTREQINPVIHAANREIVRREVDSGRTFESAAADFCKMMEIPFWNGKLERVAQYLIKLEQHLAALTACYKKTGRNMDPVVTNHHSRIGEALRGWLKEKLPGWLKKGSEVWEELPSDMRASTLAALEYFGAPPPQELLKQLKQRAHRFMQKAAPTLCARPGAAEPSSRPCYQPRPAARADMERGTGSGGYQIAAQ
jgi:hypothetical protein